MSVSYWFRCLHLVITTEKCNNNLLFCTRRNFIIIKIKVIFLFCVKWIEYNFILRSSTKLNFFTLPDYYILIWIFFLIQWIINEGYALNSYYSKGGNGFSYSIHLGLSLHFVAYILHQRIIVWFFWATLLKKKKQSLYF